MATVSAVTPNESVENHLRSSIKSTTTQDSLYSPKKIGSSKRVYSSSSKTNSPYQKSSGGAVGIIKKAGADIANKEANKLRGMAINRGVDAGAIALSGAASDVGLGFAAPLIMGARKPLKKLLNKKLPKFHIHF
jgi:hypothetical protein